MHKNPILQIKWFVANYASEISKSEVMVLDMGTVM